MIEVPSLLSHSETPYLNTPSKIPSHFIFSQPNTHTLSTSSTNITVFQLNCHNRKDTTYSVLETKKSAVVLLLQEPWTKPITFLPPTHANWHLSNPLDKPTNQMGRPRCCIYVNRIIPSYNIYRLLSKYHLITISLTLSATVPTCFQLLSVYNPPSSFEGFLKVQVLVGCQNFGTTGIRGRNSGCYLATQKMQESVILHGKKPLSRKLKG